MATARPTPPPAGDDTARDDTARDDTARDDTAGDDTAGDDTAGDDTAREPILLELDSQDRRGAKRPTVPWRTILAVIASLLATYVGIWLLQHLTKILTWILVAGFFTVVLSPPVDFLIKRARLRRGLAAFLVFFTGLAVLVALLYSFIRPIVDQSTEFVDRFPQYVEDAKAGKGPVGEIVQKYELDTWVDKNQDRLRKSVSGLGTSALTVARSVFNTIAATLTIAVLTFLMLVQGPDLLSASVRILSPPAQVRAKRLGHECAQAVTGYVAGNLTISVIAGLMTFAFLSIIGVEFAGVLSLWVGFADLIPLVGATLGAIPTIGVAFLHSIPAGIACSVFYVIYQQFENHVLQVTIMSRTVALRPFTVLLSVLVGVELFGLLGALLAIPVAGVVKVLGTELIRLRRPDLLTPEPAHHGHRREGHTPLVVRGWRSLRARVATGR